MTWGRLDGIWKHSEYHSKKGILSLGKPNFYNTQKEGKKPIKLITVYNKHACSLFPRETISLFSKAFYKPNIVEKNNPE